MQEKQIPPPPSIKKKLYGSKNKNPVYRRVEK
jgi:hypothetical protein